MYHEELANVTSNVKYTLINLLKIMNRNSKWRYHLVFYRNWWKYGLWFSMINNRKDTNWWKNKELLWEILLFCWTLMWLGNLLTEIKVLIKGWSRIGFKILEVALGLSLKIWQWRLGMESVSCTSKTK